ncbi:hypothetical protein IP86_03115 [Rhodopseudomonas sp. AAP120]|nr:hypothetical protein IP86_03115 [Rhodopseudomonas sp. AAP120]
MRLTDERGDKVEAVGTLTIAGGIAPLAILLRGKVYQPALTFADGTLNYRHVPAWIADGVLQLTGEPAA